MQNEDINKYIIDERARGVSDDAIKKELLVKGWKEEEVNTAIGGESALPSPLPTPPLVPLISGGDLLKATWKEYTDRIVIILSILVLPILCYVIATIPSHIGERGTFIASLFGFVGAILFMLAQIGLMKQMRANWALSIGDTYKSATPYFWGVLWVSVLSGLAFFGGLLLFVIPGIIVALWFAFVRQALVFDDQRGFAALSYSRELVRGLWLEVFLRFLVLCVIAFLVALLSMIPYIGILTPLFTVPFATIYMVKLYDALKERKGDSLLLSPKKDRGLYITLVVLGVLAIILLFVLFVSFIVLTAGAFLGNTNPAMMHGAPMPPGDYSLPS